VALDPDALKINGTPEWWMQTLARKLLDRERVKRFGILDAYRSGCPPMVTATDSQRKAWQAFNRVSRSNYARTIVRAPGERMLVRAIRTAAANDDTGDQVAWRYWTSNALDVASTDVHTDVLTFSEGYVRVGQREDGTPIALRRDPRFCIAVEDPLDPLETLAAFELVWDEFTGYDYAYLWLAGEQWVADRPRTIRPAQTSIPGVSSTDRRWAGMSWWPRLSFDPAAFTMRPQLDDVPEAERDGRPYSDRYQVQTVPVVRFDNRDGKGEFEEHLDVLDRAFLLTMLLMVTAGVQAYKQRSLEQDKEGADRLPEKNPETGEAINWDEIFEPGPDALWKLPPGVKLQESGVVDLQGLLSAIKDVLKELSITTGTPFSIFSPDGQNQSAAGAEGHLEPLIFKVNDRDKLVGRKWGKVLSLLFQFAPDEDRYDGEGDNRHDRADTGAIVVAFEPPVRYSIIEKSQADSQNKSLSRQMALEKIWELTPDEIAINEAQRAQELLMAQASGQAAGTGGSAA
jgi:hypothetical protein